VNRTGRCSRIRVERGLRPRRPGLRAIICSIARRYDQSAPVGLLVDPPDSIESQDLGEVQDKAVDWGDRDSIERRPVIRMQIPNPMNPDVWCSVTSTVRSRHVDHRG